MRPLILLTRAKEHYFEKLGKILSDPSTGTKSYWTTLKNILNKKKNSVIPPLLENGAFITNFQAKADILMNYLLNNVLLFLITVYYHRLFFVLIIN